MDELSDFGHLPRNSLDECSMEMLDRLPEQDALGVLGELSDASRVRKIGAYVIGMCKKFSNR